MTKSRIIYSMYAILAVACYATTYAVGQDVEPPHSIMSEIDGHDGHDHEHPEDESGRDHKEHDEHGEHADEAEDTHEGHDHGDQSDGDEDEHDHDHDHGGGDHGEEHDHGDEHPGKDAHDEHDDHENHGGHDGHEGHDDHGGAVRLEREAMQEFGVTVDSAAPGTLNLHTTLPGEVQVNQDETAHIVPRYPGLVIEVRKKIGDQVGKGEVLAILEGNESLAPYELKSRISGTIIDKHITLGESLREDDVVFTVANLDTVWIDLTIYQKDIVAIRPGQKVIVSGGEHLPTSEGIISYVSPTVDEHTRTGHARVELPNPDGAWKPGLFVTGRIALDQVRAEVVVPKTALQTLDENQVVFVETDDGFEPQTIRVGRSNHEHVEIVSGLRPGQRYVSRGGFTIKAEMARGELEHAGHAH